MVDGVVVSSARRVLISHNPRAGRQSREAVIQRLVQLLTSAGLSPHVFTDIDELSAQANASLAAGELRAVVAAGGDGTAALVAQRTASGVPIALLPLGTENLLAKELRVTADPAGLCAAIHRGRTRSLDAGQAAGRLFLLMVGCGFDADVVRRLHRVRQGHIHHWSYAKPILDSIRNYQYPELRVYCPSVALDEAASAAVESAEGAVPPAPITARWVFVANLPCYAMGLRVVPDAVGDDGCLDVCAFQRGSLWNGMRYLAGVALGRHGTWPDVVRRRVRRVRIEADEAVPYQLDGDLGGCLPVDIEVLPRRLTVVVS